jgi:Kef-type K+ transport system membrane component KefB
MRKTVIIIGFTQLLGLLFARIRQPRVIAEVIVRACSAPPCPRTHAPQGGVLLGPTVMGRIPNFSNTVFPASSLPVLTLTANVGLVFFLFIVGLEVDFRLIRRNVKSSTSISIAGLVVPLGMGAALAIPLYNQFVESEHVNKGYFVLFVAVAVGITVSVPALCVAVRLLMQARQAFPVLCRILTETKLLDTTVGVVVLAAGVSLDIVPQGIRSDNTCRSETTWSAGSSSHLPSRSATRARDLSHFMCCSPASPISSS